MDLFFFFRTKPDGNCLYRACSKLVFGDDQHWSYLRELTSLELFLNAKFYSDHPYVQEKSKHFSKENTAFSAVISDAALGKGYDRKDAESRIEVVKREACRNSVPGTFSSLICMLALSSVIGRNIVSLYPEEIKKETRYSLCNNGLIKPKTYHEMFKNKFNENHSIILLWTKDGSSSFIPGTSREFKPNHFVPVIQQQQETNMPYTGHSRSSLAKSRKEANHTNAEQKRLEEFFKVHDRAKDQGRLRYIKSIIYASSIRCEIARFTFI